MPWRARGACLPAIGRATGRVLPLGRRDALAERVPPYGHFGREGFSWEKTDKVEVLRAAAR